MTGAINNLAGSVSGAQDASKVAQNEKSREKARAEKAKPRAYETQDVVEVEHAEAVRNLKDETQEEAREDHQERPAYGADGQMHPHGERRRLDLEG